MKLRPFELALVVIFGGMAMAALIILKVYQPSPDPDDPTVVQIGQVDIWGTMPAEGVNKVLLELSSDENYRSVRYRYFAPDEYDEVLVRALADGRGPDLVLVSQEELVEMRPRIQPVSYESFPQRDFKNSYVDGAEIFALRDGLYGYPIAVDPLMMYWNRDILGTTGYLTAPKTWESLINGMFPDLIQRDFDRTITRSVVAMGEYNNVRNAFGVISALLIQQGSQRVIEDQYGRYLVSLDRSLQAGNAPLQTTADFYTRFSKPSNTLYSWNRAFTDDRLQFIGEDLVFYFGYGSEAAQLAKLNPNLNFDIAEIPQGETATVRRTYGKFYTLATLKSSDNKAGASAVMLTLGNAQRTEQIAVASGMVPPYRAYVERGSNDTIGRVTYQSAGIALGWLNPDIESSNAHFETMVRDINENRRDIGGAVSDLLTRLEKEY